jgi:hypothetical protein
LGVPLTRGEISTNFYERSLADKKTLTLFVKKRSGFPALKNQAQEPLAGMVARKAQRQRQLNFYHQSEPDPGGAKCLYRFKKKNFRHE